MNSQAISYTELKRIRDLVKIAARKGDKLVPRLSLLVKEMESAARPECRIVVEKKD